MPENIKERKYCNKQVSVYKLAQPPVAISNNLQVTRKTVPRVWALACLQATQLAELIKAWGTTGFLPGQHMSTEKPAASMQPEAAVALMKQGYRAIWGPHSGAPLQTWTGILQTWTRTGELTGEQTSAEHSHITERRKRQGISWHTTDSAALHF